MTADDARTLAAALLEAPDEVDQMANYDIK